MISEGARDPIKLNLKYNLDSQAGLGITWF